MHELERVCRALRELADAFEAMGGLRAQVSPTVIMTPGEADPRSGLTTDPAQLLVIWRGHRITSFTRLEFEFITYLAARPGVVRTRAEILDRLWRDEDIFDRNVDSHVKRIRRKFRVFDPDFEAMRAVYGMGYVWDAIGAA